MVEHVGLVFRVTGLELRNNLAARAEMIEKEYWKRLGVYQEQMRSGKYKDATLPEDYSRAWRVLADKVDADAVYWLTIGEMREAYLLENR